MAREADIEVEISFLSTEEGGRRGFASSKYCPQYVIGEGLVTGGAHQFIDVERVYPGESALALVWFLSYESIPSTLWVGRKLRVQEADKLVAHAEVTKILNESLQAHS
jgi:translation elongation factor EF-Tu-like GTPase